MYVRQFRAIFLVSARNWLAQTVDYIVMQIKTNREKGNYAVLKASNNETPIPPKFPLRSTPTPVKVPEVFFFFLSLKRKIRQKRAVIGSLEN